MSTDQKVTLCGWLNDRFYRSTVEIRAHISKEFGLRYSHSGCIKLLARLGFGYRKPKALPWVASTKKQANFITLHERTKVPVAKPEHCENIGPKNFVK
jgi:transposase